MIPPIVPLLTADAAVTALVGDDPFRIYPFDQAPLKTEYPYITYTVVSGTPQNKLDSVPSMDVMQVQMDVWGSEQAHTLDLAAAARDVLETHAHMTFIGNFSRDPQTRSYRVTMTFDYFNNR